MKGCGRVGTGAVIAAVVLVVMAGSWGGAAFAVMPPEHYIRAALASEIKAVARITAVEDLEVTARSSRKQVTFSLIRAFEPGIPHRFRGTCHSVDRKGQNPGVGGRLYYYPVKGLEVLVTVSRDGGAITSMTPMTGTLDRLTALGGLSQVQFAMGWAVPEDDAAWSWYLFTLKGEPRGYLAVKEETGSAPGHSRRLHFMVGNGLGKKGQLFRISARAREDKVLSLEGLTIEAFAVTEGSVLPGPVWQIGFVPGGAGIGSGILTREAGTVSGLKLPPRTTSDFLLFSLVPSLEQSESVVLDLNVVETLELHLKTGLKLRYTGRDPAKDLAHQFVLDPGAVARYWVDGEGRLGEVAWDNDKAFVRMPRGEVLKRLVP